MSPQHQGSSSPFDPFHNNTMKDEKKIDANNASPEQASEQASTADGNSSMDEEDPFILNTQLSDSSSLDPFGIASLTQQGRKQEAAAAAAAAGPPAPAVNRTYSSNTGATTLSALPPKMLIKLTTYEEVTSVATVLEPGTSRISIEGSVYVQLHSSDARRNAPFQLVPDSANESIVAIKPNNKYSKQIFNQQNPSLTVTIPKNELGYVPVVHYSFDKIVDHMPVLLERKVTIHEESCRIAFQVRSKLTNQGDLRDFTLAVAVPEKVDADSIEILRGDGVYDGLKRLIKFKMAFLNKGESFMVSAQAKLWKSLGDDEEIHFPVVMRCNSCEDQISNVNFSAVEAPGQPSSLTIHKAHSFRLLHRLS